MVYATVWYRPNLPHIDHFRVCVFFAYSKKEVTHSAEQQIKAHKDVTYYTQTVCGDILEIVLKIYLGSLGVIITNCKRENF